MPGSIAASKDKAEHVRFALILRLKLPIEILLLPLLISAFAGTLYSLSHWLVGLARLGPHSSRGKGW
jgi:hypothetical protein